MHKTFISLNITDNLQVKSIYPIFSIIIEIAHLLRVCDCFQKLTGAMLDAFCVWLYQFKVTLLYFLCF